MSCSDDHDSDDAVWVSASLRDVNGKVLNGHLESSFPSSPPGAKASPALPCNDLGVDHEALLPTAVGQHAETIIVLRGGRGGTSGDEGSSGDLSSGSIRRRHAYNTRPSEGLSASLFLTVRGADNLFIYAWIFKDLAWTQVRTGYTRSKHPLAPMRFPLDEHQCSQWWDH